VETAIAEVRKLAQGDDIQAIRKATDDLQNASHAIAQALYAKANDKGSSGSEGSKGSSGSTGAGSGVKDGEVVDAEYAETA